MNIQTIRTNDKYIFGICHTTKQFFFFLNGGFFNPVGTKTIL